MQKIRNLFFLILALCVTQSVMAQVKFYSQLSEYNGRAYKLSFYAENGSIQNFTPPKLDGWQVVNGPMTSNSVNIVNGSVSRRSGYEYIVQPTRTGKLLIGEATAIIDGKRYSTQPISSNANSSPNSGNAPSNPANPHSEQDNSMSRVRTFDGFLKAVLSKESVYSGEQLILTYKLYTNAPLVNINVTKMDPIEGCWSNEIEIPNNLEGTETYKGKEYNTLILRKVILIPQIQRDVVIPPMGISALAKTPRPKNPTRDMNDPFQSDLFEELFDLKMVPVDLVSDSVILHVKNLPATDDTTFTGAIGKYQAHWQLPATISQVDQPLEARLVISGEGNLKFLEAPILNMSLGLETFDPVVEDDIREGSEIMQGSRTFVYNITPKRAGNDTIKAMSFTYFDPSTQNYEHITIPDQIIKSVVAKNNNPNTIAQIAPLMTTLRLHENTFFLSPLFFILTLIPILILLAYLWKRKSEQAALADPEKYKNKTALKSAQKRLQKAEEFLAKNNKQEFYSELRKSILQYIGDKTHTDSASLTKTNIKSVLEKKNVSADQIDTLLKLLDKCELALYAPTDVSDMKNDMQQAQSWIEKSKL